MKRNKLLSLIEDIKDMVLGSISLVGIAAVFGTVAGVGVGCLLWIMQLVVQMLSGLIGG